MLRETANDVHEGNTDLPRRLRSVGNKFMNSNVMTAQETVYHCLSMPLVRSSRDDVHVNTVPARDRVRMLKSLKDMKQLDDDSEDIYYEDIFHNYEKRRRALDDCCLAEYVTEHKTSQLKKFGEEYEIDEDDFEDQKRTKPKILRYRGYRLAKDRVNYYREQVLLFLPWRNEFEETESKNCEIVFNKNKNIIKRNMSKFAPIEDDELEDCEERVKLDMAEEQEGELDRFLRI
ncbi:hypothetical protein QAD02_013869 [Eretmocerus hayati]|uniref:Uncharacterized protein n=1 Tax=Eretmocerus hayati TaxID=131215 RepID=A0ACC2P3W4_9HYME|nr:hypothetical protein QAD02_013869 [Eretmocerus hayati]